MHIFEFKQHRNKLIITVYIFPYSFLPRPSYSSWEAATVHWCMYRHFSIHFHIIVSCWCLKNNPSKIALDLVLGFSGLVDHFTPKHLVFKLDSIFFSEINFLRKLGQGCSPFMYVWVTRELDEGEICEEVWTGLDSALVTGSGHWFHGVLWGTRVQDIHPLESGLHHPDDPFSCLSQILYFYPFLIGQNKVSCTSLSWDFR